MFSIKIEFLISQILNHGPEQGLNRGKELQKVSWFFSLVLIELSETTLMNENLKKVRNLYTWPRRLTFTNNCEKCSEVLIINFSRSRAYRSSKLKQGDKGHQNSNPPNYAIRDISQTWLEPIRSKKVSQWAAWTKKLTHWPIRLCLLV